MKSLLTTIKKEILTIAKGSLVVLVLLGGAAAAATFTQPSQSPPGGNVEVPINASATAQAKAGNFAANALYGKWVQGGTGLCIKDDCRTAWPEGGGGGTDLGSCKIDTKIVYASDGGTTGFAHGTTGSTPGNTLGNRCYSYLTNEEAQQNWTLISFDNCPGVQGNDCAGTGYCAFVRLSCDGGVTVRRGDTTRNVQPAGSSGSGGGGGGGNPNVNVNEL